MKTKWTRTIVIEGDEDWVKQAMKVSIAKKKDWIYRTIYGTVTCTEEKIEKENKK